MTFRKPWIFRDRHFTPSAADVTNLTFQVIMTLGDVAWAALDPAGLETAPGKTPNPVAFVVDPDQDGVRVGDYVQLSDLWHLENQEDQTAAKTFQMSRGLPVFSELAQEHKTVKTVRRLPKVMALVIRPPTKISDNMLVMGPKISDPVQVPAIFWPYPLPKATDSLWWIFAIPTEVPADSTIIQTPNGILGYLSRKLALSFAGKDDSLQAASPDGANIFISRIIIQDRRRVHDAFPTEAIPLNRLEDPELATIRRNAWLPPFRLKQFMLTRPPNQFNIKVSLGNDPENFPLLSLRMSPEDFSSNISGLEAGKVIELNTSERRSYQLYVIQATSPEIRTTVQRNFMTKDLKSRLTAQSGKAVTWKDLDEEDVVKLRRALEGLRLWIKPADLWSSKNSFDQDDAHTLQALLDPECPNHRHWTPSLQKPLSLLVAANLVHPDPPVQELPQASVALPELLNKKQKDVISGLCRTPSAVVMRAAAGAGKSRTIGHACMTLRQIYPRGMIIVCGPSNDSVANLQRALQQAGCSPEQLLVLASATAKMKVLPGERNTDPSSAFNHLKRAGTLGKELNSKLRRALAQHQVYPPTVSQESLMAQQVLKENDSLILVATNHMVLKVASEIQSPILAVLIDEAGQMTSTEVLALMCALPHPAARLLLAGDTKQLASPIPPQLQRIQNIGLQSSLLSANSHPQTLKFDLAHSFRFTERLAWAIGHACYNDNLLSAGDRPELKNFSKFPRCSMAAPIAFHECSTMESRVQKSFTNHGQVHQAVELLEQLAALRPEVESGEASVVVLSPYAAAVTEKFPAMRVRAATVDQYQGQEAEVAFFITTRTATQNHRKTPSSVHHSIPALVLK